MNTHDLLVMLLWAVVGSAIGILLTYFPFKIFRKKQSHLNHSISPDLMQNQSSAYHAERREPVLNVQGIFEQPATDSRNGSTSGPLVQQTTTESLPEFIALYLIAPSNNPYTGYELWQALINHRLEYGALQIFHRFSQTNTETNGRHRLFSVANTAKPGHFDRVNIGSLRCPGLCLFVEVKSAVDLASAYQEMLFTAKQLNKALGGILYNEQRHPLEFNDPT